jgi:hypothetical protein
MVRNTSATYLHDPVVYHGYMQHYSVIIQAHVFILEMM